MRVECHHCRIEGGHYLEPFILKTHPFPCSSAHQSPVERRGGRWVGGRGGDSVWREGPRGKVHRDPVCTSTALQPVR